MCDICFIRMCDTSHANMQSYPSSHHHTPLLHNHTPLLTIIPLILPSSPSFHHHPPLLLYNTDLFSDVGLLLHNTDISATYCSFTNTTHISTTAADSSLSNRRIHRTIRASHFALSSLRDALSRHPSSDKLSTPCALADTLRKTASFQEKFIDCHTCSALTICLVDRLLHIPTHNNNKNVRNMNDFLCVKTYLYHLYQCHQMCKKWRICVNVNTYVVVHVLLRHGDVPGRLSTNDKRYMYICIYPLDGLQPISPQNHRQKVYAYMHMYTYI